MLGEQLVFAVTLTFPLAFSAGEEYWSMDFVPLKEAMFPSSLEEGGAARCVLFTT